MAKRIMSGFITENNVVMGLSMYDYFSNLILYSDVKDADSMISVFRFFRDFILYIIAKNVQKTSIFLKPASGRSNYTSRTDLDIGLGFFN
jgi:hypothetical protein